MSSEDPPDVPKEPGGSGKLPDATAAIWLLIVVGGFIAAFIIVLLRIPIADEPISPQVLITNIGFPLAVGVAFILILGTYVSLKELMGSRTTNTALTRIIGLVREAGAAKELRQQVNGMREKDDEEE